MKNTTIAAFVFALALTSVSFGQEVKPSIVRNSALLRAESAGLGFIQKPSPFCLPQVAQANPPITVFQLAPLQSVCLATNGLELAVRLTFDSRNSTARLFFRTNKYHIGNNTWTISNNPVTGFNRRVEVYQDWVYIYDELGNSVGQSLQIQQNGNGTVREFSIPIESLDADGTNIMGVIPVGYENGQGDGTFFQGAGFIPVPATVSVQLSANSMIVANNTAGAKSFLQLVSYVSSLALFSYRWYDGQSDLTSAIAANTTIGFVVGGGTSIRINYPTQFLPRNTVPSTLTMVVMSPLGIASDDLTYEVVDIGEFPPPPSVPIQP